MESLTETLRAPWRVDGTQAVDSGGESTVKRFCLGSERDVWPALVTAVNSATADDRDETPFVIWSNEHRGWWKPKMRGYTSNLEKAGCYSRTGAEAICYAAGPSSLHLQRSRDNGIVPAEIMMRLEDARRSTVWYRNNQEVTDALRK